MKLKLPQDQNSSFQPKILPKHKKDIIELESKVISLYAMGTSTRDAMAIIKELEEFAMDPSYISKALSNYSLKLRNLQLEDLLTSILWFYLMELD